MIGLIKTILNFTVFFFFIAVLSGCGKIAQHQIDGKTMGTYYSIKIVADLSPQRINDIQTEIDIRLERLNALMSTYRNDSELMRFNHSHLINQPFTVSKETEIVIREALRIADLTDNALDITAAPLVNLWGFGPDKSADFPPSETAILQRLADIGLEKLSLGNGTIAKSEANIALDLSSIAKGYAVDVLADYLSTLGIERYLIDIGGEVRAKGHNGQDQLWRIAIEKPSEGLELKIQRVIELDNLSVATSGNYRNYGYVDGVRYSHTIDPKTGYPIKNHIASITVIAPLCMTADGFATGLGVLGPERAIEIANRINLAIFILLETENGIEERYSKAFEPYLSDDH